jgi:hypothetical protein
MPTYKILPILLVIFFLSLANSITAQKTLYAAAKTGLNVREMPDINSPAIAKIGYGVKLTQINEDDYGIADTEGMRCKWVMITDGTVKGYAAEVYCLPFPPPKENGKDLKGYLTSLAKVQTSWKKDNDSKAEESAGYIEKTIFSNGVVLRQIVGYESYTETVWIPNLSIGSAYVLARLLCNNSKLLDIQDAFPKNSIKQETKTSKEIKIFKMYENFDSPTLVRFDFCEGSCYAIEIHEEEGEVSITFSNWV